MPKQQRARRSSAELKAIAYHLADLIETRAVALQRRDPALSRIEAINAAMADLAQGSRRQA